MKRYVAPGASAPLSKRTPPSGTRVADAVWTTVPRLTHSTDSPAAIVTFDVPSGPTKPASVMSMAVAAPGSPSPSPAVESPTTWNDPVIWSWYWQMYVQSPASPGVQS